MADLTLEQAQKRILEAIQEALWSKSIQEAIIKLHHQAIEETVYNEYTPTLYERRYDDGGLLDENNLDFVVDIKPLERDLVMYNSTTGTGMATTSEKLTEIIESGIGYDWVKSDIYRYEDIGFPLERPFIQRTRELIEDNRELFEDILKKELIKNGLKIE